MNEPVDVSRCTPGPATSQKSVPFSKVIGGDGLEICDTHSLSRTLPEYQANAALIAEAFTVASETGKGPRKLANMLAEIKHHCDQVNTGAFDSYGSIQAIQAILTPGG